MGIGREGWDGRRGIDGGLASRSRRQDSGIRRNPGSEEAVLNQPARKQYRRFSKPPLSLSLSTRSWNGFPCTMGNRANNNSLSPFLFFYFFYFFLSVDRSIDLSNFSLPAGKRENERVSERVREKETIMNWKNGWRTGFEDSSRTLWITLFGSADMDLSLMGVPHDRGASLFSHIRKNKSVSYNFRTKRIGIEAWYRLKNNRRGFLEISSEFLHLDPIAFYYFLFHISSVQCFTHRVFESRRFFRNAWKNLKQGERRRSRWMDAVPGRMLMRARRRFLVVVVPEGQ